MKIAPETLDASVPNMILQPLVEERYQTRDRAADARWNDSRSPPSAKTVHCILASAMTVTTRFGDVETLHEGVGLSNTRRRLLRHLYGENHKFEIEWERRSVRLTLPFD
ncbi:MAG: hypothetical protein IPN69_18135 [Acidobacteria bacterium]|nr:hypothetical protein [Acidobacteriota bacterium]